MRGDHAGRLEIELVAHMVKEFGIGALFCLEDNSFKHERFTSDESSLESQRTAVRVLVVPVFEAELNEIGVGLPSLFVENKNVITVKCPNENNRSH